MSILNITPRETALEAEFAALQAKVASLEKQAPVAWGIVASNTGRICQIELDAAEVEGHKPQYIRPLFLAAGAQATPAGYQLVPVEPTPEMLQAIWAYKDKSLHGAYRAMLAAAPVEQRQPLTRDQMLELLGDELDSSDAAFINFGRAVEQAHDIKEHT